MPSADTKMYEYAKQINPPDTVGINDRGTWKQVGKNINGLESYFQVLSKGGGKASKQSVSAKSGGMGNRYFVPAVGKCGNGENRNIYMDHIPTKRSAQRSIFKNEVGFVPGLTNNVLQAMDPDNIVNALSGSAPDCVEVNLTQVNSKGENVPATSKWVSKSDAADIDACWFSKGNNPHAASEEQKCTDGFANISDSYNMARHAAPVVPTDDSMVGDITGSEPAYPIGDELPLDTLETLYVAMLSGVGLYALHRLSLSLSLSSTL